MLESTVSIGKQKGKNIFYFVSLVTRYSRKVGNICTGIEFVGDVKIEKLKSILYYIKLNYNFYTILKISFEIKIVYITIWIRWFLFDILK